MTDHPKVAGLLSAIADHGAGPPAGPGRTLGVGRCAECPMYDEYRGPMCGATTHLPRSAFAHMMGIPLALDGSAVHPGPPPDWCPLRGGPVTLEVRDR
jgi:hypothetical protein